jgi:hypothetical protein
MKYTVEVSETRAAASSTACLSATLEPRWCGDQLFF